jgi:glycosyltransferase involved in cell wall biosynthesis
MPPRIAYWTSGFEPEMEAISAEVALLRRHFPKSVAWGLSHRHWLMCSRKRGYCLNPRLHVVFRVVTRMLGPAFGLNHVIGSLGDWFYLNSIGRGPTVLTVAAHSTPVARRLLDRVDRFVVEYPAGRDELHALGIETSRTRLIFPPVDLDRFSPGASGTAGRERLVVLFASSPERAEWLEARGVPIILDAAAQRPAMHFRLLWRPWGNGSAQVRQWVQARGFANVELVVGHCTDMAAQYRAAHVTVAPFTRSDRCKPAPNSLVESMACGRPVITTRHVGLFEPIVEARAGLICEPNGSALADALDRIQSDWARYSTRARQFAERQFDHGVFLSSYTRLYEELT